MPRIFQALNKLFAERRELCVTLESAESTILQRSTKAWRKRCKLVDAKTNGKDEEKQENIEDPNISPGPSKELLEQLVPPNKRPKHRTGFLGIFGKKVDTVEYCKVISLVVISRLTIVD
jgi:hypothetical protein